MSTRAVADRLPVTPGSKQWLEARRQGLGASEIAIVTGDSPWGDIASLYADKLGYAADLIESPAMSTGRRLEDVIARWYSDDTGRKVRRINALYRNRERPWMLATPDRQALDSRLVELKSTSVTAGWGPDGSDQVPDHYLEQAQWQAAVTGAQVVDLAVFFFTTRRLQVHPIRRDQGLIDELIEYGAAFWRCVETRTPPDPVGRSPRALLRADEIEADAELTTLVTAALAIREDVALAERRQQDIDDAIRARLDAVGGARGDGFRIHYRPQKDRETVAWQKVAAAYRQHIEEEWGAAWPDELTELLDRIQRDLTSTRQGPRPLLITTPGSSKESTRAIA